MKDYVHHPGVIAGQVGGTPYLARPRCPESFRNQIQLRHGAMQVNDRIQSNPAGLWYFWVKKLKLPISFSGEGESTKGKPLARDKGDCVKNG